MNYLVPCGAGSLIKYASARYDCVDQLESPGVKVFPATGLLVILHCFTNILTNWKGEEELTTPILESGVCSHLQGAGELARKTNDSICTCSLSSTKPPRA